MHTPASRRYEPQRRPTKPTMHPRKVWGGVRLGESVPSVAKKPKGYRPKGQDLPEEPTGPAPIAGITVQPAAWIAERFRRLCEQAAPPEQFSEGHEYARIGQTRRLEILPGLIRAKIQGRMPEAYQTEIRMPVLTPAQWNELLGKIIEHTRYAAGLQAGELPASIEDLTLPMGVRLFPAAPSDLALSCTCDVFRGLRRDQDGRIVEPAPGEASASERALPWCKHVCCAILLVADRLSREPFTLFRLRGMAEEDLIVQLRERRLASGVARTAAGGAGGVGGGGRVLLSPVFRPHLPGLDDRLEFSGKGRGGAGGGSAADEADAGEGLERADSDADTDRGEGEIGAAEGAGTDEPGVHAGSAGVGVGARPAGSLDSFWRSGAELSELDLALERPAVSHPLLRRLGPTPFEGAKFPLVGLLATCYDVFAAGAVREAEQSADEPSFEGEVPEEDGGGAVGD